MEKIGLYKVKNILIIAMSLEVGGAERSLVNLLKLIDYSEYQIDLLLFKKKGAFLKDVPTEVHIVENRTISILFQPIAETFKYNKFSWFIVRLSLMRYIATLIEKLHWKQFDQMRVHRWVDYFSKLIPNNNQIYDAAVAYSGGETTYYMVEKVLANYKTCFFHSDFGQIEIDPQMELPFLMTVDRIVTISDFCKASLESIFPSVKDKIIVLENLSSSEFIKSMSEEFVPPEFIDTTGKLHLVSIGRLHKVKGYDLAIEAAKLLKDEGIPFIWLIVGEGRERHSLEKLIHKYKLSESFHLIGNRDNPYPYIKNADIVIQTSRFEGKSLVIDEAKILSKPFIITNYNSAKDQIEDGIDGKIVEMTPRDIADGILDFIKKSKPQKKVKESDSINPEKKECEDYIRIITGN